MSAPDGGEPTEVAWYILMPTHELREFAADANCSANIYAKEVRSAWKVGIFSDADMWITDFYHSMCSGSIEVASINE